MCSMITQKEICLLHNKMLRPKYEIWHLDTGKLTDGHIEELSNEVDWVTRILDIKK